MTRSCSQIFTDDAWQMVLAVLKIKEEGCTYFCPVCQLEKLMIALMTSYIATRAYLGAWFQS